MGVPGDREINTTGVDRCKPAENVYLTCWGIFLTGALIFFFQFHFVFCFGILMQSSRWLREINNAGYHYQTLTLPNVSWFGNALRDMTELY